MSENFRKVCSSCKKYPRTVGELSKKLKCSKERIEAYINRGVNEGYLKRTDRGSLISRPKLF